ncbi:eukaryotic mitochondrial regulator protein-domain-containing protein [Astrocystis sublimbata]|nr:eukaryotic mitochondrial regulator protein-domain-containing protein [Astrocystis sublimbata]
MPPIIPLSMVARPSVVSTGIGAARWSAVAHPSLTLSPPSPSHVPAVAAFSTTASRPKFTKIRRQFREWERNAGRRFRRPAGKPQYLTDLDGGGDVPTNNPFPQNMLFKNHGVLDDKAREIIWEKIMRDGETIKAVSAEHGVDIRRVAAIVRLKEVEKDWIAKKKLLAKPYARAVLSMLPTHSINRTRSGKPFEPINELHVHPYTMQQIFWPTSESRHFTREDAAKAFHETLLSPDQRVPHPELIQMERDVLQGLPVWDASERFKQAAMESERKAAEKQAAKVAREEKMTQRVNTERFEFRFKMFNSENVGSKGKARNAVGWRYGAPHDDRSKDHQIKIPTSVP